MQLFVLLGSIMMALAVVFGAFGAHALKSRIGPEKLKVYETGVQYHIAHAIGLLLVGLLHNHVDHVERLAIGGWLLFAGIILFSGSLYVLSVARVRIMGPITPLGGLLFIAGWIMVGLSV